MGRGGAVSSRSFDLLNLMILRSKKICRPKMTVLIRCYIHPKTILLLSLFRHFFKLHKKCSSYRSHYRLARRAYISASIFSILARRKRVEASAMSLAICAMLNFHSAHTTEWAESISGNGVCMYVLQRLLITLLGGVTDRYNHTYSRAQYSPLPPSTAH